MSKYVIKEVNIARQKNLSVYAAIYKRGREKLETRLAATADKNAVSGVSAGVSAPSHHCDLVTPTAKPFRISGANPNAANRNVQIRTILTIT